jgi:hypothetical protein
VSGQVITQAAAAVAAPQASVSLPEATSTLVLAANPERAEAIISVPAGDTIFLGLGEDAVATTGIAVVGGGEPFRTTNWKGDINAISATAIDVAVTELVYNAGDPDSNNELDEGASTFVPEGPSDGHPSTDVPTFNVFGQ